MINFREWAKASGFIINIDKQTVDNQNYRKVLYTSKHTQLVLMSLKPNEEIGMETHGVDQFFRVEAGLGELILDGKKHSISAGTGIIVPAGIKHNIINNGSKALKIYTLYSPPHHKDGVLVKNKEQEKEEEYDGKTSF